MNGKKSKSICCMLRRKSIVQVLYDGSVREVDTENAAPAQTPALRPRITPHLKGYIPGRRALLRNRARPEPSLAPIEVPKLQSMRFQDTVVGLFATWLPSIKCCDWVVQ